MLTVQIFLVRIVLTSASPMLAWLPAFQTQCSCATGQANAPHLHVRKTPSSTAMKPILLASELECCVQRLVVHFNPFRLVFASSQTCVLLPGCKDPGPDLLLTGKTSPSLKTFYCMCWSQAAFYVKTFLVCRTRLGLSTAMQIYG